MAFSSNALAGVNQWTTNGPNGSYVQSLAVSPNFSADRTIFAGTFYNGIFKSTDGGSSWSTVNTGLTNIDVYSLAISPNFSTDQTIFAATYGGGYFKSTDGGSSWNAVGLSINYGHSLDVSPNFSADQTVFAGAYSGEGVFKSTDGGSSWSAVGLSGTNVQSLAVSPSYTIDQTIFAGTWAGNVFKSTDGGSSWNAVNIGPGIKDARSLAFSPNFAIDQTVFAATYNDGIFRSTDGGSSWNAVNTGISNALFNNSLAISPNFITDQTIFAGADVGIFKSTNSGLEWSAINSGLTNAFASSLAIPSNFQSDQTIFAGFWNGGGVYSYTFSSNQPPTLDPIGNKTIIETELLSMTLTGSDPDVGDSLTYSATGTAIDAGATFNPITREFSWIPSQGQVGTYNVHFEVSDGNGGVDSEDVAITVTTQAQSNFQTVLSPGTSSWEAYGVGTSYVFKENGIYKMYYSGNANSGPIYNSKIGYAESTDGINWTNRQLVHSNGDGTYDHTYSPWVIKEGGTYKMYHTDYWKDVGGDWSSYISLIAGSDGVNWSSEQTVLEGSGNFSDYDDYQTGGQSVVKEDDGSYSMWYHIRQRPRQGQGGPLRIVRATSQDGINWSNKQLVLPNIPSTAEADVSNPDVVKEPDGTYTMYYLAGGSDRDSIGSAIYRAKSTDGINWTNREEILNKSELGGEVLGLGASNYFKDSDGTEYLYFAYSKTNSFNQFIARVSLDYLNVVNFPDPNLEAAVREALNKPIGNITDTDMATLITLNASNRNISDITGLESAINLNNLYLDNNQITDLTPLQNLNNLIILELDNNQISNIAPLQNLFNLTDLILSYNQITDITPLQNLTNLTNLWLDDNQISNTNSLQNLTKLINLNLRNNQVSDIASLQNLSNLINLWLYNNQVSNITSLQNLTNLNNLYLDTNQITDITPLQNLNSLNILDLDNNQISNVAPLQNLTNLTDLFLKNNQINDINSLILNGGLGSGDFIALENNYLDTLVGTQDMNDINNLISRGATVTYLPQYDNTPPETTIISGPSGDIETNSATFEFTGTDDNGSSGLTYSYRLDGGTWSAYSSSTTASFSGLAEGPHTFEVKAKDAAGNEDPTLDSRTFNVLHVVTFADPNLEAAVREALGKPIGNITDADMATLTTLIAESKGITNIQGLEYATNLTNLNLNDNQINDIIPLANLTDLTILQLQINHINDITSLLNLSNLQQLDLSANQISNINVLVNLSSLSDLQLLNNQISVISPLANLTNLTKLGLSGNQISEISSLNNLVNLNMLSLNYNQISDTTPLENMNNLTFLDIGYNPINNITPVADMTNLNYLFLYNNHISDISPLANLNNLTLLWLQGNQISDINPLQSLTQLTYLRLENNQISDITPLILNSGLGSGDNITLQNNYLDLLAGSQNMNDINTLITRGATVYYDPQNTPPDTTAPETTITSGSSGDIDTNSATFEFSATDNNGPIGLTYSYRLDGGSWSTYSSSTTANFTGLADGSHTFEVKAKDVAGNEDPTPDSRSFNVLHVVTFADPNLEAAVREALNKPIGNITDADMATFTSLNASFRNITNIQGLEYATNLRKLFLRSNQISDISPLQNLTSLSDLDLPNNQVSDISPLQNLTSLSNLSLARNQISNINPLQNLTSLRNLDLSNNQINNISPLQNLTSLSDLRLSNNQISNISPLQNLINIFYLTLGNNQISDISPLQNLTTSLRILDLPNNQVSDISPLQNLTRLDALSLENNQISNISPLQNLINLSILSLPNNQISDITPLVLNFGFASGDLIYLQNNYLDTLGGSQDMNDINTLISRGANVTYLPQYAINHPPVLDSIGGKEVNEGSLLTFTVSATDSDSDPLTYSASNLPAGASFNPTTKVFSWTPGYSQANTYPNIHFEVSDGKGGTDSEDITITVINTNQAPVLNPIPDQVVIETELLQLNLSGSDPDGNAVTYSSDNAPEGLTINPDTGAVTWTPTNAQIGSYDVNFTVTDGALTDTKVVRITVKEKNKPPVLSTIGDKTVVETELLQMTLTGSDPDGDAITYSASNLPQGASFNPITKEFNWTPTSSQAGTYPNVHFEVSDGRGGTDFEDITITVQDYIEPPAPDTQSPSVPTLSGSAINSSQVSLLWTASTDNVGVTGYKVYNADTNAEIAATTSTSYLLSSLSPETTYNYYVKAYDAAQNYSSQSNTVSVTTTATQTDNTQNGTNTEVSLGNGVSLTFDNVTSSGTTTVTVTNDPPSSPPSGFRFRGYYFDLTTTATFSGDIIVKFPYNEEDIMGNEESLKLFHWTGSAWEDITVSVDTTNNIITGKTSSLSPFSVGEPDGGSGGGGGGSGSATAVGYSDAWLILTVFTLLIAGGYLFRRRAVSNWSF